MLLRKLLIITMTVLTLCCATFAQEADGGVNPENVELLPLARPMVEYTLAGGILLAALAIGFMPSKRTKDA